MTFSKTITTLLFTCSFIACKYLDNTKNINKTLSEPSVNSNKVSNDIYIDTVFTKTDGIQNKYLFDVHLLSKYLVHLNPDLIDSIVVMESKTTKSQVTYLGEIMDLKTRKSHYVFTDFTIIGINEMESPRGSTKLIFINNSKEEIATYNLSMPDERPNRIIDNQLIFQMDTIEIRLSISGGLPNVLCIPQIDCY